MLSVGEFKVTNEDLLANIAVDSGGSGRSAIPSDSSPRDSRGGRKLSRPEEKFRSFRGLKSLDLCLYGFHDLRAR